MNLTKRTLCIVMALAVVLTTLVFVSVGASVDFPIHNTIVSFSGGSNLNCNEKQPEFAGGNKIAYSSAQDISINASISADATNLKKLVEESEFRGEYVLIDFYAEFTSSLDKSNVAASFSFGAGDVEPTAKNTNVLNPTSDHSFDFVDREIVTVKLWKDQILTGLDASLDDLTSVTVTIAPEKKDIVTGTFFFSAPYYESDDGENVSTVNITSIKTTTKAPEEAYEGDIVVHESGVKYTGKHNYVQSITGGVTDTKGAKVFYGDAKGFEGQYLHLDGTGQQIQLGETQLEGLADLKKRALDNGENICIDIYANNFTNGSVTYDPKCDFYMYFNGGTGIGSDSDRIIIKSGVKKTVSFSPNKIGDNSTNLSITFQNYSYGDYKSITNAKFIVSAPYVESDPPSSVFSPTTTSVTTTTVPSEEIFTVGDKVTSYNNGVSYTGKMQYMKPSTNTLKFVDVFYPDKDAASIETEVPSSDESGSSEDDSSETSSTTEKGTTVEKNYFYVEGTGSWEGGGQQIQFGNFGINGLAALKQRAIKNNDSVCIDIYSTGMPSNCYFKISFAGGSGTGDYDRLITNNKKQTLVFSPNIIGDNTTSVYINFLNYTFGSKTIGGKFIVSVPYIKSDFEVPVKNGTTGTTYGKTAINTVPETESTTTSSTTAVPSVDYEEGDLNFKLKDSIVTYTGGWGNPTDTYSIAKDKKTASVQTSTPYQNIQIYNNASNLSQLILDALEQGKNIGVDLYGNFLSKGKDEAKAKARVTIGGKWYGTDPDNANGGNESYMKMIYPKEVTTIEINPRALVDSIKAQNNTTVADTSVKQVENLAYTGTLTPEETTLDTKEVMHTFSNPSVGDYIEYTIPSVDAGSYNISLVTRDYTNRGTYSVYINGELIKDESFYNSSVTNKEHLIGECELSEKGDIKVKIVYKEKGEGNGSGLYLDGIKVLSTAVETSATTDAVSDEAIAAKFTYVQTQIFGGGGWNDVTTYGRFYMSVPYIIGAEETDPVQGVTTTTTRVIETTEGEKFTNVNDMDFGYVDCRYELADWNANGSDGQRAFDNRVYKIVNRGSQQQQVGALLNLNGGGTSMFNKKDFSEYVEYAKEVGALLAIDVFPSFSMSDNGSLYCHMNTTWYATGDNNKNYKAENLTPATDVEYENYIVPEVDATESETSEGEESTTADPLKEIRGKTLIKYADVKEGDVIEYTLSGVNPGKYSISANAIQDASGAVFAVSINGEDKEDVSFNSAGTKYGNVKFGSYRLNDADESSDEELAIVNTNSDEIKIKLVCKKAGSLVLNSIDIKEDNLVWPTTNKAFKLTAGKKYTYLVDPKDLPNGSSKFSVYFDSYEYSPGWRAMQNVEIYMTAPYLAGDFDKDATTTTTTTSTSTKTTTIPESTYEYPSNNKGGSTKFYIESINTEPASGKTIRVPIMISGNQGLYNAKFSLYFNKNYLTYRNCTIGDVFDTVNVNSDAAASEGVVELLFQNSQDTLKNGVVAYLEFRLKSTTDRDIPIIFAGSGYKPSNFFNYNGDNVPCSFRGGYVIVDSTGSRTAIPDDDAIIEYPSENLGTTKFKIESVSGTFDEGTQSKEYKVNISVSGNAGLSSAKFTIQYDPAKLEFIGSEAAKNVPPVFNLVDYNLGAVEYDRGIITYNIVSKSDTDLVDSTNNGKIVTMTFKVLECEEGDYTIKFGGESYSAKSFLNASGDTVPCSFEAGGITLTTTSATKASDNSATQPTVKPSDPIGPTKPSNSSVNASTTAATTVNINTAATEAFKIKVVKGKKQIKISYKKVAGVSGFQVRYKIKGKWKVKTFKANKNVTKVIKKLKKGTYKVQLRLFKNGAKGRTYSKWSKSKKVKVK